MKKQKYYIVMTQKDTEQPPLAMFQYKEWAEEWRDKMCATGIIELREMGAHDQRLL